MVMSAALVLSSCGTYEATGAYTGARFGSVIGSAIGGISGGWRGSDLGTIVVMAGGAIVGAAIGRAADNQAQQNYEERMEQYKNNRTRYQDGTDDSGFDPTGKGDDRIFIKDFADDHASLEIHNARLLDASHDNTLSRGEEARMVFELSNRSSQTIYRVLPDVSEITGNKHIRISENVLIESILPNQTIRYTAVVKADNRLKDGEAIVRVNVYQGRDEKPIDSQTFRIRTSR